jgi:nicotinamidase-related amidase
MSRALQKPKSGGAALLIIDMINDFEHEDGSELFEHSLPAAHAISELKKRCADEGIPIVYVNDNFQEWRASFATTVERVEKGSDEGRKMVELLRPGGDDYYVLKPHRSGFYKTPLGLLLDHLDVSHLIITGITTDMCVMQTCHEAHMRGFQLTVPSDCTAAVKIEYHEQALRLIERTTRAHVVKSSEFDLKKEKTPSK